MTSSNVNSQEAILEWNFLSPESRWTSGKRRRRGEASLVNSLIGANLAGFPFDDPNDEEKGGGHLINYSTSVPFICGFFVFHFRYCAQATEITFILFFSIFIMFYRLNELIVVFLLLSFQNRELQIMRRLEHCNIVKLKYFFYSSGDKVSSWLLHIARIYRISFTSFRRSIFWTFHPLFLHKHTLELKSSYISIEVNVYKTQCWEYSLAKSYTPEMSFIYIYIFFWKLDEIQPKYYIF